MCTLLCPKTFSYWHKPLPLESNIFCEIYSASFITQNSSIITNQLDEQALEFFKIKVTDFVFK